MPDDDVHQDAEAHESTRPHVAARVEDRFFASVGKRLRRRRWEPRVEGNTGYGEPGWVRILARTVLTPCEGVLPHAWDRRGWRSFVAVPAPREVVQIELGSVRRVVVADRGGYIDLRIDLDEPLAPGWHTVRLTPSTGVTTEARVIVVGPDALLGVVSDIDDTVMDTRLPRPFIAAWNTFVVHPSARRAVPGMAALYRDLRARYPDAPFVYLSTGAWNTAVTLRRFLDVNGYPPGPLLLTDWGPTNTGWFRSGVAHKTSQLERLLDELPHVRWILVGDDGQHDPDVYDRAVREHPGQVSAVAIRELTATQQVLSHGLPVPLPSRDDRGHVVRGPDLREPHEVPVVRGLDGDALRRGLLGVQRGGGAPSGKAGPAAS
ncbi:App1 family protein [Luteimicrobium subarcticum]|uniref:Phosphatidate phosphatase APP1 n=1 Tax=Luteimicrobium subarcticum TaxID=620910 RepID=A0A2M8WJA6_9MICO|nr:phosphatase domain-containing protein [Luteimicrobium subarcticum]PJI91002.1 phosphatidate phosphatase APP1 [Luteimicrobium subarcticum]